MADGYAPGIPDPRDLEIVAALEARDAVLTEVRIIDGPTYRVFNIAWGYDAGDSWAHVTTNISPFVEGEAIDVFSTSEVDTVRAPESGQVLVPPAPVP